MAAAYNRNALHVLRMVLDGRAVWNPSRLYSATSTLLDKPLFPSLSSTATRTETGRSPINFLEDDENDYSAVRRSLSPRSFDEQGLPWPTLFASEHEDIRQRQRSLGGTLHRLVERKDYETARKVFAELEQAGVRVPPSKLYLKPAAACLKARDIEGFFKWLNLYPARRPSETSAEIMEVWGPIALVVRTQYTKDIAVVRRFLLVIARLKLLPQLFRHLISHITLAAPPSTSLAIVRDATEAYMAAMRSGEGHMDIQRGKLDETLEQIESCWNIYLRRLLKVGHKAEARMLYEGMEASNPDVKWSETTQNIYRRLVAQKEFGTWDGPPVDHSVALDQRVASALTKPMRPTDIAVILRDLRVKGDEGALEAFKKDYQARLAPAERNTWSLAQIIDHRLEQRHFAAIKKFRSLYLWYGLPPLPEGTLKALDADLGTHVTPSIYEVTSIISSVLFVERSRGRSLIEWQQAYLDALPGLPPSLQPTVETHRRIVADIIRHQGTKSGERAIANIIRAGRDPILALEALLLEYARKYRITRMASLLRVMENNWTRFGAYPLPTPRKETYHKLQQILQRNAERDDADLHPLEGDDAGPSDVEQDGVEWDIGGARREKDVSSKEATSGSYSA